MKKIAVIPIDNRPVCYTLFEAIAKIDDDIQLFLPDRKLLGGLHSSAKVEWILEWLKGLEKVDAIIISLDTIAYGGLVSSRRCENSLDEIKSRLERFKEILKEKCDNVYAFSSIMRISNNNVNEEEKEYWSEFGKKIFEYSYNFHKNDESETDVPLNILEDYLVTRKRNFEINKMYLDWAQEGDFKTLVFSKDDCAEFGLNVMESQKLERDIEEKKLPALVKTGADEIPLTLFARAMSDYANEANSSLRIHPKFLAPTHKDLISNYEDISIEKSVQSQIELAGCKVADEQNADIILIVNNFEDKQGEIVMGRPTKPFSGSLKALEKSKTTNFAVADVRFANGADNKLVDELFKTDLNFENFYGYSAWNTSANSLGSLICACVVRFFATRYNEKAFKELQLIRFLDDWAYQANIRQILKEATKIPSIAHLKPLMTKYEKKLGEKLGINPEIGYNFPWNRFFEVEIIIK